MSRVMVDKTPSMKMDDHEIVEKQTKNEKMSNSSTMVNNTNRLYKIRGLPFSLFNRKQRTAIKFQYSNHWIQCEKCWEVILILEKSYFGCLELSYRKGIKLNSYDSKIAFSVGHLDMVKYLLEYECKWTNEYHTKEELAAVKRYLNLLRYFDNNKSILNQNLIKDCVRYVNRLNWVYKNKCSGICNLLIVNNKNLEFNLKYDSFQNVPFILDKYFALKIYCQTNFNFMGIFSSRNVNLFQDFVNDIRSSYT